MKKILTVIGARPQIIKAAAISRAISEHFPDALQEVILHTGQHYDTNMSEVFFEEMGIPRPDINLQVGSGSHGEQTARMLDGIEKALLDHRPDALLVYGDTNSTLAGALAAAKLHIPVVHVESGLRSFNKRMPEELNRITCDHCSTLLFVPTQQGMVNLKREGFNMDSQPPYTMDNPAVFHCGDVMYDNSRYFAQPEVNASEVLEKLNLVGKPFVLCTVHRDSNTDNPTRLNAIFRSLLHIAYEHDKLIVLPLHPRTLKYLNVNLDPDVYESVVNCPNIVLTDPVSYLDMVMLESRAEMVITDSGGVQKEAFFFEKPCIILRSETEWVELVENGNAIIADADQERILAAFDQMNDRGDFTYPQYYGDGMAARFICHTILEYL
ncbi:MAG: UDP-N-acetylglucosamine 2-epimerase (non-hydrolyzing) [Flavobacteriales bacterium]|nr:UDP-N-acetylglucosamine 2-epimerase (non-hydrolyzing) [Flavobacteriales bacterium]